jgi:flagellar biogenesis protein FliO
MARRSASFPAFRASRARWVARLARGAGVALVLAVLGVRFLPGGPGGPAPVAAAPVAAAAAPAASNVPATADATASVAFSLGAGSAIPTFNAADIIAKALLVLALVVITLRIMRRVQAGPRDPRALLRVVETRTIGPKAQVVLVAVGDHRLVVGLSPAGMTTLADLPAAELAADAVAVAGAASDSATPTIGATRSAGLPGLSDLPSLFGAAVGAFRSRPGSGL